MDFDRRQILREDLGWKETVDGRQPSMEDNPQLKITLDGR